MQVSGLKKSFGDFVAVNGVDLDLYEGQIFSLLGHNGAVRARPHTGLASDALSV